MTDRQTIVGVIIATQEERFRIVSDTGKGFLLSLGSHTHLPASLNELVHSAARVLVTYEGASNLASGVVTKINLI